MEVMQMKTIVAACPLLALVVACGATPENVQVEQITAASADGLLGWIGPVSDEQPNVATCGSSGEVVTGARCEGSRCDRMSLYCEPLGIATTPSSWTIYISEEPNDSAHPNRWNEVICGSSPPFSIDGNYVIDGIRATGNYADNVSVHCAKLAPPYGATMFGGCEWTPYFSDGTQTPGELKGAQSFPTGKVAIGVRCRGSNCDDMSYRVCNVH
jgi:hypothetical protein